ncbi:FKBP-type peptidyl-prolyl cis-trans isomerase [Aidingimonas lacisalsi]|uniref:FKBP-type peptidyl-prolyl cis-trans isomerase n=1 Tax=Aidingimonas lacisalsi TaxID=2604086 RepID=UPI0011D2B268|nr:FKBP-type peptidyl-prolyl cis-trans isomerase [Aidingimonas lacisalsi]
MKTPTIAAMLTALLGIVPLSVLAEPQNDEEKLSYSLGVTLGQSLVQDIDNLDLDTFTQAIEDVYADDELAMSEEEIADTLSRFQEQAMAERQAQANQQATSNQEEGRRFLAENAENEDVNVTDSGLQYKILESGNGPSPTANSSVEVHYEGTLLDGQVFDSSYDRGEPVSFRVDQVIEGWQEALQLMSVGDTWMIYVPAELGYGAQGQGPIGPNETLTFKVELLGIE